MKKLVHGIGPVVFRKYRRSRNINIHVSSSGEVKVTLPLWVPYRDAENALRSKKDWVVSRCREMAAWRRRNYYEPDIPFEGDRGKAAEWIIARAACLAEKYGFFIEKITVRDQKARWGSCSPRNNISLNRKLAWIPEELADYVILHELVHTRIKNHGKEFWEEMDRIVGRAKELDRRLRQYHLELL
ncbi:MAG: DUF45 domain-containing protein [Candidatus Omnitrophica bacterium]|nr:DUF45 domain-containing protein [Candidatus Omnitrophota bacterium]